MSGAGTGAAPAVVLRLVAPGDEAGAALARMLVREYVEWAALVALERHGIELGFTTDEAVRAAVDDLRGPGARLYLAEHAGATGGDGGDGLLGVGGLKPLKGVAGEVELKRMYVRPAARGLGAGRALLGRLVDDARAAGCSAVRLESATFMPEALALYRSAGFRDTGPYPGREFHGFSPLDGVSVFMALPLAL